MVFASAYRILGNAEDADDALQEAFLHLLRRNRDCRGSEDVRDWGAYLKVVATRCAIDILRSRPKWRTENVESIDLHDSGDSDPSRLASQRQKADMLREALSSIPERDAQVFALRWFDDLSYEMIATQMNLSISQVGVILHRTRNRLQQMFKPQTDGAIPRIERGDQDVGGS
jgi:RNA polymerase sigma-70 factor (ECF subfamily)